MAYTASQAAKATGKSIPTITRAIKNGKISAVPNGAGWLIDPAELHRVFPPATKPSNGTPNVMGNSLGNETPNVTNSLELEVKLLREMLAQERGTVEDLRKRLDTEADERKRLTLMLTDQRAKPEPKRSLWSWLK